jgi:ABC-type Fe3+/spermidine/putrescine transport system ATPase subunit
MRDGRIVQDAPPTAIYDAPADAFVANFVGRANLLEGVVVGPAAVDTPVGRIATREHAHPPGSRVRVLIRPERIEVAEGLQGENALDANVVRDRFFGATRRIEVTVGDGRLEIETNARDTVRRIRIPRDAIQFLNDAST